MTTTESYGCDKHGEDAYQGCAMCDLERLTAENAALKAQLAYAASTGDESAIEVESLRSRLAEAESRQTCEGTQPYICHALATARSRLAEIIAYCAQEGNDGEPYDTINAIATGEYSTRGEGERLDAALQLLKQRGIHIEESWCWCKPEVSQP